MSKTFAFIFARGGSQGLPGKNIMSLGGLPLLAHSIFLAQDLTQVSRVFVSTDSPEIAAVARNFNAQVILRPKELATNTAPEWKAWQHAIHYLTAQGESFEVFLSLPAVCPLRAKVDVEQCLQALKESIDLVVTVTPAARSPYFNMVTRDLEGISEVVCKEKIFNRRQDPPQTYDLTPVAYVCRPQYILHNENLFAGRVYSVIIPKERALDIDDAYDFKIAKAIYEENNALS